MSSSGYGPLRLVSRRHLVSGTQSAKKPAARIAPETESVEDRIHDLVRIGFADWNGKYLKAMRPVVRIRPGAKTLSEIVSEGRD